MGRKLYANGSNIHLTDSSDNEVVSLRVYGKAEQKQYSGKNLLENTASTQTINNVTFAVNEDGVVNVNGQTSDVAVSSQPLCDMELVEGNKYILSGGVSSNVRLYIYYKEDWTKLNVYSTGNDTLFTVPITGIYRVYIRVLENATITNALIKPMLRLASITDSTYEPYVGGIPSPNPDYPQDITVSGSDGSVEVKSVGKNVIDQICVPILDSLAKTHFLKSGVYTITRDSVESGKMWFFGAFDGNGSVITESAMQAQSCALNGSKEYYYGAENLDTVKITLNVDCYFKVGVLNSLGTTYFMMSKGDKYEPYEPYKETTSTIPTPNGLCGIKVSSGGNYTDENGQMWICDEVVKYADGSGKRIERIKHYSLAVADMNNSEDFPGWLNVEDLAEVFGSGRNEELTSQLLINVGNRFSINTDSNLIFLRKSVYNLTQTEWKTKYPDLIVEIYAMRATPIITDLSAEEIAEIEKLYTFYPVTNISNDADCGMAVTYVSTLIDFIQPKTDWTSKDAFDYVAYNRVTNNIMHLKELADYLFSRLNEFNLETEKDNLSLIYARHMNDIENGLESINLTTYKLGIGEKKTYKSNGNVPDYQEYNRIESACLALYNEMQVHKANLPRLAFRLGNQKGIRV